MEVLRSFRGVFASPHGRRGRCFVYSKSALNWYFNTSRLGCQGGVVACLSAAAFYRVECASFCVAGGIGAEFVKLVLFCHF